MSRFNMNWAILVLLFIFIGCKSNQSNLQELKPWHSAGNKSVDEYYTTDFMTYQLPREMVKLNENWTFNFFPEEADDKSFASMNFDDSKWSAISIPHSYQNYETTRQEHPFIMNASEEKKSFFRAKGGKGDVKYWYYGWGYYRKNFTVEELAKNERIFVEFEGVMKYCKVYLNGKYLGEHKGGFNAFYFDITDFITVGKENVLAVAVNNRLNDKHRIPPMQSGNQTHSGGIYRDVKLVKKSDVYIPFQGSAAHEGGTFITVPRLDENSADVNVRTWIKNDQKDKTAVELVTKIESPERVIIAEQRSSVEVASKENKELTQLFQNIENPIRWSVDSPQQYKVISEVFVDGKKVDYYESPLGFRTFAWDYTDNWGILNGKKIHIHGTNRTQCFPWVNNAIPDWMDVMDMRDVKFGQDHNFIRPNIHANKPLIHDLFDQWGVMVNLSSPMIKNIDFDEEVQKQMVTEAIRRHRNRPSIVMYSTGNETNDGADSKWIHEEDSTRIITARHVHGGEGDYVDHTDANMDMENLLRCTVRGWTHDDVFDINPSNNQHTGNEEFQHKQARVMGGSQRGRIDMHNGNMWMYCDDGAIRVYKHAPLKWVNPKGWVDVYRVPKYLYFLWQAHYHEEPMVFIHQHFWQEKYVGEQKDIIVDSNCDEVELFVNGESKGKLQLNAENFHTGTFKGVDIEEGELKAVATRGKEKVETIVKMAKKPAALKLTASHQQIDALRSSVVMLTVDARDENGIQVQAFNQPLKWSVSGPAKLIAPEKWTTDIHKRSDNSGVWYIAAPVANFIRSTGKPGTIKVKVESEGLLSAEVELEAIGVMETSSFVSQPRLSNTGRKEVEWKAALKEVKEENASLRMNYIFKDIQLTPGNALKSDKAYFQNLILKENPQLKKHPKLVGGIANNFAQHVSKKAGLLVNDDYNFMVDQVNEYLKLFPVEGKKKMSQKQLQMLTKLSNE
ncbi:glycoside hydrolase family 2 protein [Prolixibacteraceae bacterium JC049]|nr:glycoside hydrolase family 2 protein [Prolixibacteraceae bacterium JC049]